MKEPAVFMNVSPDGEECAISVSALPELRPLKLRDEFFLKRDPGQIDTDPEALYEITKDAKTEEVKEDLKEQEEELVDPYLFEYVFIIDRSGSMYGLPI